MGYSGRILELLLDESRWLSAAMLASLGAVLIRRRRRQDSSSRVEILRGMNLFYGCTIGVLSFGHLLAVAVKVDRGTVLGSPWRLFPIGLVLAVPAWWLAFRAARLGTEENRWRRKTAALNAWLGICLLAFGLHTAPLVAPAALNVAYLFHSRRAVGWTILTATVIANLALFIGSLTFLH